MGWREHRTLGNSSRGGTATTQLRNNGAQWPTALPHLNLGLRACIHEVLDERPNGAEGHGRVHNHSLPHQLGEVVLRHAGGGERQAAWSEW